MQKMKKKKIHKLLPHLVFLGPSTIIFTVIMLVPILLTFGYSFTDWNGISDKVEFVGLKNFIFIFSGKATFLDAFWFTFGIAIVIFILTNLLGIALAVALSSRIPISAWFRAIFFLPNTMGGVLLGFIWRFIFIIGFSFIGEAIGLKLFQLQWLGTFETASAGLIVVSVWQSVGYVMVIMIAGLAGVPNDLLEAAKLDGVNSWQNLIKIRLPLCMPYITICLFWTLSNALKMFDLNVALTKGGPYGSTTSMALNIYNDAFAYNKFGLATAEALIFSLIILVVTSLQMYLSRKAEADYL